MNYLNADSLEIGQTFTHPLLLIDDDDTVFLPAKVPVRERDIQRLYSWNITQIKTLGVSCESNEADIILEVVWSLSEDNPLSPLYNNAIKKFDLILERIYNHEKVAIKEIEKISASIMDMVEKNSLNSVRLVLNNSVYTKLHAKASVTTALLAITIGIHMELPRHRLFNLCSGALLHDVGMQRIPQDILEHQRALLKEEMDTLKVHPRHSYHIIKEMHMKEDVAQIALQHHENWDGGGYPSKLQGNDIILEARILAVVDSFDAMINDRPWRKSFVGYEAMRSILSDNQRRFDPAVVKSFIQAMGLYPVGSLVLLSDGSVGQVISTNADAQLRPKLHIIIGHNGEEYTLDRAPVVDLLEKKSLYIVHALDIISLLKKTRALS